MKLKVNPRLVNKRLNDAWNIWVLGNPYDVYWEINKALFGNMHIPSLKDLLSKMVWLRTYEYPEIKQIKDEAREEFALVTSWNLLMDHFSAWWAKKECLASIVGTTCNLDIDIKNIQKELGYNEELPVPTMDTKRYSYWQQLFAFQDLSLSARSLFIRIIRCAETKYDGLADSRKLWPFRSPEAKEAIFELSKNGLITTRLSYQDLLMIRTTKELKEIARNNALHISGSKSQIVQEIILGVKKEISKQQLNKPKDVDFIRPLIADYQKLKNYLLDDTKIFDLYLDWIKNTECTESAAKKVFDSWIIKLKGPRYKPLEPWRPSLAEKEVKVPGRFWKTEKMNLLRSIWDANCDKLLSEVAANYAWDWGLHIEQTLCDYLPPEKMKILKRACKNNLNLHRFSQRRLDESGILVRKPSILTCAGCEIQFMDWSVDPRLAERVGYKIHFCQNCYYKASGGSDNPSISEGEMLEQLSKVANVMGMVPTSSFRANLNLAKMSDENQIVLIKTLMAMPAYETYVKQFGSWLQALILAGILEDGIQRTSRGVRCIANDGHVCNSLAEKTIDDWLSGNNIPHEKEPHYPYHVHLNLSMMRADWKVKDILIEYAGLLNEPTYAAKILTKQKLAKELGISLIIIKPEDILELDKKLESVV